MERPKNIAVLKLFIAFIILNSCLSLNSKDKSEDKSVMLKENKTYDKVLEAFTTLFLSGLFDRSFFITAFMAIKYPKMVVLVSAGISLSLVGLISVFLGVAINSYIPALYIDILSIALFLFFGLKMIMEGLNMPKNLDLIKLEETHIKITEHEIDSEKEKLFIKENQPGHSHLVEVQKQCEIISNQIEEDKFRDFKVFSKIFILIFASEIGDRSQISTIYITNNFDKMTVITAVLISQNLLTIIAISSGSLISKKVSERFLNIIAGSVFLIFGIVALYLVCTNELILTTFDKKKQYDGFSYIIPDRNILNSNF